MQATPRIRYLLITGAGLICLAILVAWWFGNYELVEQKYRDDVSLAARRNPFLAAELFLRKMGTKVESVHGRSRLRDLPAATDILLVNEFDGNLAPERYDKLLDWIDAGGQLIITADRIWNDRQKTSGNRLLDEFGIHLRPARGVKNDGLNLSRGEVVKVDLEDGNTAKVVFNKSYHLEDVKKLASMTVDSKSGIHLLQIPYGDGLITIMSDNNFLKNPASLSFAGFDFGATSIADNDNAYFLWQLVRGGNKVWLVYNSRSPSISTLLWEKAPQVCIAFIILAIFWLWSSRNRFGPPLSALEKPRRNLLEHIQMTATYEWRQDGAQKRLRNNRELIQQEIRSRHPHIAALEPAGQCAGLAKISGLAEEKINLALYRDWQTEREFIQITNLLRSLRQLL